MNLVQAEKSLGCHTDRLRHPAAIFRDMGGIVIRAEATIEAGINALGGAALAAEKAVTQARNGRKERRSRNHGDSVPVSCPVPCPPVFCPAPSSWFSSLNPANLPRGGSETASTLNL